MSDSQRNAWRWALEHAQWRDVWRGYAIAWGAAAVAIASAPIAASEAGGWWSWMNGAAAVISAVAALTEARSARSLRDQVEDHEVRLRVIEREGVSA